MDDMPPSAVDLEEDRRLCGVDPNRADRCFSSVDASS